MIAEIRRASSFDIPYISEICLKTGFYGKDASDLYSDPHMLAQFYAIPYIVHSTEHCYVVEAEMNRITRPVGYILGTENSTEFGKWLEEEWMMQLRKSYKLIGSYRSDSEKSFIELIQNRIEYDEEIVKQYPAHFHIDILPAFQRMGYGAKLTKALWDSLKSKGVAGVHMGYAANNAEAAAFYRKAGYTVLKRTQCGAYSGHLF